MPLLSLYRSLPEAWRRRLTRGFKTEARRALIRARLVPYQTLVGIGPSRPDDVFIVSFPRSGNTLVRFLTAHMRHPDRGVDLGTINALIPELPAPSPHGSAEGTRLFKTHEPFFDSYPRMIYVVRDGRDALVSYYHRHLQQGKFAGGFDDYLLATDLHRFTCGCSWAEHVEGALAFQARHPDRVLLLRYETMIQDLAAAARQIDAFAGLGVDEATIARAVERCAFDTLKQSEARVPGASGSTMFRRGQPGAWAETFSPEAAARFWAAHGPLLTRLGYAEHPDTP